MAYRNKTYVAFASEDIRMYRMMEAWRDNANIDFNFFDSHDLFMARDTSTRETIRRRLRERLTNTAKQVVLIGTQTAKSKGGDNRSFLAHEVDIVIELGLPVVIANISGSQQIEYDVIPEPFVDSDYYTLSVSFRPKIIQFALDNYAPAFRKGGKAGPHFYRQSIYDSLGL